MTIGQLCLLAVVPLLSQVSCDRMYLGLNYGMYLPQEELEFNNFGTAHGANMEFFYKLGLPSVASVHLGARLGYAGTQGRKNDILVIDPVNAGARSSVYNRLLDMQVVFRFVMEWDNRIKPYAEFYGGGRFVGTAHRIRLNEEWPGYERSSTTAVFDDASWLAGAGAGVLIALSPTVDFDFRTGLNYGQLVRHGDMDSYQLQENDIEIDAAYSVIRNTVVNVGFRFKLNCMYDSYTDRSYRRNRRGDCPPGFRNNRKKPTANIRTRTKPSGNKS